MTPDPLTPKQKTVLDFVTAFTREHGYAPTISEIGQALGLSSSATVHKHLQILAEKGHLDGMPRRSRWLTVKAQPTAAVRGIEIPLLGKVAAGCPIEVHEVPASVAIPEWMLGRGETFALQVAGESMIDESIRDGDLVIVEKRDSADNGEMVIACIDHDEVTFKRLYHEGSRVRLQPSNPAMAPIIVENRDVTIRGVVIGILRKYRRA